MRLALLLYTVLVVALFILFQMLTLGSAAATSLWNAAFGYPLVTLGFLGVGFVGFLFLYRKCLQLIGRVTAWLSPPTGLEPDIHGFPHREVDLLEEIEARPPGMLFVGLTPERRSLLPGWKHRPLYLTDSDRSTHRHVLGRTGSGKTTSVLWPQVLQDALDGKGVAIIDAKGSDENIGTLKAIAEKAGRKKDLRIFSLPAWDEPDLFTHSYNLVQVRPRSSRDRGGNVTAMAERVLSILPLGDNVYFNTQARLAFINLCRVLHGLSDQRGNGIPFNLEDLAVCVRGVGGDPKKPDGDAEALMFCLDTSADRRAADALRSQVSRLGSKAHECLSGLSGALESFMSPVVNAYAPDLVFEEALEKNQLIYAQLPTNLFKLQAPAAARAMLMDIQQAGSMRQVFRKLRNQRPFSVVVDEFASFADLSIIESLNKLRDANLMFTLSHQSLADLELVSPEFAQAVFDNCLTRDVLAQDNPELCERVAKSLGTWQREERTVQIAPGPIFTEALTGTGSSKLVEAYRLHPNAIKALPRCGQGYLLGAAHVGHGAKTSNADGASPVCYPRLPDELLKGCDYPLQRNDQRRARGLRLYERFVAGKQKSETVLPLRARSRPKGDANSQ